MYRTVHLLLYTLVPKRAGALCSNTSLKQLVFSQVVTLCTTELTWPTVAVEEISVSSSG